MAHDNGQALGAGRVSTVRPDYDDPADNDRFDLKNFDKLPARQVPISALSRGLYLRQAGTNIAHVKLLIDAGGSAELPPILVQEHGWRVIDGLHRLEAAKIRGDHTIKARFLDCTDEEALVLAIKANASHGLPLSKADRVSGAKRVLAAHPDWSDRAIGGITGLSGKTIASLRARSSDDLRLGGKRFCRDGRRRPVSADEGRRRAAEYISAHPDAPLRQVAREADVSLGTVHDVRARLRRGVNPELNGRGAIPEQRGVRQAQDSAGSVTQAFPALSPSAGRTPPQRKKHSDAPPTWAGIAVKVANDPAVRYTEGGKEFLRWMALHATHIDDWRGFLRAIPDHWVSVIAPMADGVSEEWGLFAERLRSRQEMVR